MKIRTKLAAAGLAAAPLLVACGNVGATAPSSERATPTVTHSIGSTALATSHEATPAPTESGVPLQQARKAANNLLQLSGIPSTGVRDPQSGLFSAKATIKGETIVVTGSQPQLNASSITEITVTPNQSGDMTKITWSDSNDVTSMRLEKGDVGDAYASAPGENLFCQYSVAAANNDASTTQCETPEGDSTADGNELTAAVAAYLTYYTDNTTGSREPQFPTFSDLQPSSSITLAYL